MQYQNDLFVYFDALGSGIDWKTLTLSLTTQTIEKGDYLFQQGDQANRIYFLHTGLVRYVSVSDEGKEFTQTFVNAPRVIGSTKAMVTGAKALFGIQALQDCVISSYPWQDFYQQMRHDKGFLEAYVHFLEWIFITKEERESELIKHSAERRYLNFCTDNRLLKDIIPQQYIASYIGITPEALSRIRKQLQIKRLK